jgi:hypothetical protein
MSIVVPPPSADLGRRRGLYRPGSRSAEVSGRGTRYGSSPANPPMPWPVEDSRARCPSALPACALLGFGNAVARLRDIDVGCVAVSPIRELFGQPVHRENQATTVKAVRCPNANLVVAFHFGALDISGDHIDLAEVLGLYAVFHRRTW